MSGIGHNSEAYGEQIQEPSFVLSEDHKKLFHYVQWHLSDYITGTQGMTPEQEGVYIRFLVRLYDRGQAFQDDDKLMALAMGLDVRRWRRVRADLIQFGKIIIKYGCLTNARFEREKLKRAEELRKQAENTRKYWEERRRKQAAADQLRADFSRTSEESPKEVAANFDEKPNEINKTSEVGSSPTRDQRLENKKEEEPPIGPPKGEKQNRARRFPDGWVPSPQTHAWARNGQIGANDGQIVDQFEAFRDFHVSKGSRFVCWDRAFQTWMRNAKSYGRLDKGRSASGGGWSRPEQQYRERSLLSDDEPPQKLRPRFEVET